MNIFIWLTGKTQALRYLQEKIRRKSDKKALRYGNINNVLCPFRIFSGLAWADCPTHMQKAVVRWEAIRRHDTDPKQRAVLVTEVLKEV